MAAKPSETRYIHNKCRIVRVIDGDTVVAEIDVGFRFKTIQHIRLLGCDMPEARTPLGRQATAELSRWLDRFEVVTIETFKQDSFGRWLCWVTAQDQGSTLNASAHMIDWLDGQPAEPEAK